MLFRIKKLKNLILLQCGCTLLVFTVISFLHVEKNLYEKDRVNPTKNGFYKAEPSNKYTKSYDYHDMPHFKRTFLRKTSHILNKKLISLPVIDETSTKIHVKKKDWINYTILSNERLQKGPGEQGEPIELFSTKDRLKKKLLVKKYSWNVVASDMVSLDRSLKDVRHEECHSKRYRADLPAVSVIILFHDEYHSALKRTVHSVVNRTPAELLKEIILVDDNSTKTFLKKELDEYMMVRFKNKVRILRLTKRHGLMRARMAGIENSTTNIVVVMDGHMEVTVNWLPPLIEPIVDDSHTMTQPFVDVIDSNTLKYDSNPTVIGERDGFNWKLGWVGYKRIMKNGEKVSDNFETPVIMGAVFAINKYYFWSVGGYDSGLQIWGGEQFELSWKIWMCGGNVLTIPCSHVGHNYKARGHHPYLNNATYILSNFKRIVDVWADEYKSVFYDRRNLSAINSGDVTQQISLRKKLKCKSFNWYLSTIIPDIFDEFPINTNKMKAYGTIQSVSESQYCIDLIGPSHPLGIWPCDTNLTQPRESQFFLLTQQNQIRVYGSRDCWDTNITGASDHFVPVQLYECHGNGGNQRVNYDQHTLQISNDHNYCLEADFTDISQFKLYFTKCNITKQEQRWMWGYLNNSKKKAG